jgi:hypothetical protein
MLFMKSIINALVPDDAVLLAGSFGKGRKIRNMRTITNTSMLTHVQKHDLIFLTGSPDTNEKDLSELLSRLPENQIAGVIINSAFFVHQPPVPLILQFEQLQIPLLSLSWPTGSPDLQQFLFKKLLSASPREEDEKYKKHVLKQLLQQKHPPYLDYDEIFHTCSSDMFYVGAAEFINISPAILSELEQLFRTQFPALYITAADWNKTDQIILLLRNEDGKNIYDYKRQLEKILRPLPYQYKIGLSHICTHWDQLAFSYEEAQLSIFIASELSYELPFIVVFQDMPLLQIIKCIPNTKLLETYVHETLGRLEEYDAKNHADTLDFLRTWIMYSGNSQKISSELFIHRNSVNYRINKIKKILGYSDLTYPVICNLCFAFLVRRALRL